MSRQTTAILASITLLVAQGFARDTVIQTTITQAELYSVQLKNVVVPRKLLSSVVSAKGTQAALADSRLYVEVVRNGEICWRSPLKTVDEDGTQERFDFPQNLRETSFAIMWKPGDDLSVQVKVAENKALVKATTTGAGAGAGAGIGALIGGVAAGAFTGGLGAPAGALIGAAIGGGAGAGIGAVVPAVGAREVVSFPVQGSSFGLDGVLEKDIATSDNLLLSGVAKVEFVGKQRKDTIPTGKLELQKKYVVRLRKVFISGKASEYESGAKYYMVLTLFGEDKPFEVDLGNIDQDTTIPFENTFVFKNIGGTSAVEIRRRRWWRGDAVVFKARQGQTGGTSWIFCGKAEDDAGSFVEFETFPAED